MKAVFSHLCVNYILVEEEAKEATLESTIIQGGKEIRTSIVVDLTDLNRLFLKLNALGVEISLSDNFDCYQTSEGNLYTLKMSDYGWENIAIDEFEPMHNVRQIRA